MSKNTNSIVKENNKWFSRKNAFSYLDLDLESKVRIEQVLKVLKAIFNKSKTHRFLDIGCGDGHLGEKFSELGYEVYGMDMSDNLLVEAKKNGIKTTKADASGKLPYRSNYFDYIFAGEIIEHLYDTELIMSEIKRVLKPGGFVLITTPNLVHLPERALFLQGKSPGQVQPLHHFLKFHIRQFTHSSWKEIFNYFNFKVVDSRSTIVVFERDKKNINLVVKYSKLLADIWPSLGASIVITAKKIK